MNAKDTFVEPGRVQPASETRDALIRRIEAKTAVIGILGLGYVARGLSYGGRVEQYTKLKAPS